MQLLDTFDRESPLIKNPFEHSNSYDSKFSPLNQALQGFSSSSSTRDQFLAQRLFHLDINTYSEINSII